MNSTDFVIVLGESMEKLWPVVARSGMVKTSIITLLAFLSFLAVFALLGWNALPRTLDKLSKSRWDLDDKTSLMDARTLGKWKLRLILATVGLIAATAGVAMFLPQIGPTTMSFDQFENTYNIRQITPDDKFDQSLLTDKGNAFIVKSKNTKLPVKYVMTTGNTEYSGSINISNGRAQLVDGSGAPVSQKTGMFK